MSKVSAEEKRWRAESDADTMARYEEILSDPTRMRAATKMAKERAADLNRRASVMSKVSSTKARRK